MLDSLRGMLGDDKFFVASREFYQTYKDKFIGTSEFRSFWKAQLGDQGKSVDLWLDSRGGLPSPAVKRRVGGHSQ